MIRDDKIEKYEDAVRRVSSIPLLSRVGANASREEIIAERDAWRDVAVAAGALLTDLASEGLVVPVSVKIEMDAMRMHISILERFLNELAIDGGASLSKRLAAGIEDHDGGRS